MKENFNNKINQLELTNFTCFSQANFEFSSGINVFIGENGTGKTHILKAAYALSNTSNFASSKRKLNDDGTEGYEFIPYFLFDSLLLTFKGPDFYSGLSTGKLRLFTNYCRKKDIRTNTSIKFSEQSKFGFDFVLHPKIESLKEVSPTFYFETGHNVLRTIFLPTTDILNTYRDILTLEKEREHGFDLTYTTLASALIDKPLKNKPELVKELENDLKIEIIRKGDEFFIKFDKEEKEIHTSLVATGINKLAQIIYLIMNGSLTKDSILFWDEPEVNLNPKYISLVAKFLQTLAKAGVQIFVATHDYLLVHQLSLAAEYREQTDAPPMKFFSLAKGDDGTVVESGNTLAEIQNNAILDEYAAFYDLENTLFVKSRPQ